MIVSGEQPTVLIIEDERELADLFAAWLLNEYDCRTAYDGQTALEIIDDDVDVVLLDRRMPGLSGDAVLTQLRERGYRCPVGMVTAVEPDFDIVAMGFDDYIVKPVAADDLQAFVASLLSVATYEDDVQEFFRLSTKRATLEAAKNPDELERNQEYQQLLCELKELKGHADAARDQILDDDAFSRLL